jgi:hypothetical protein
MTKCVLYDHGVCNHRVSCPKGQSSMARLEYQGQAANPLWDWVRVSRMTVSQFPLRHHGRLRAHPHHELTGHPRGSNLFEKRRFQMLFHRDRNLDMLGVGFAVES